MTGHLALRRAGLRCWQRFQVTLYETPGLRRWSHASNVETIVHELGHLVTMPPSTQKAILRDARKYPDQHNSNACSACSTGHDCPDAVGVHLDDAIGTAITNMDPVAHDMSEVMSVAISLHVLRRMNLLKDEERYVLAISEDRSDEIDNLFDEVYARDSWKRVARKAEDAIALIVRYGA